VLIEVLNLFSICPITGDIYSPKQLDLYEKLQRKSEQNRRNVDTRWQRKEVNQATMIGYDRNTTVLPTKTKTKASTKKLIDKTNRESGGLEKQTPEFSEDVIAATRLHWRTMMELKIKMDLPWDKWKLTAAKKYDSAFKNKWATPAEVGEVFEFVKRDGFWADKVRSPKNLFALKDGQRKFTTVLNQSRKRGRVSAPITFKSKKDQVDRAVMDYGLQRGSIVQPHERPAVIKELKKRGELS